MANARTAAWDWDSRDGSGGLQFALDVNLNTGSLTRGFASSTSKSTSARRSSVAKVVLRFFLLTVHFQPSPSW